jgi:sarcosine oxidase subunit beta
MDPVVVVGGGIVGASVASHLARRSIPVTLFERDALGGGTTSKSLAMFVWHQSEPEERQHRLRERAWETYRPLIEEDRIGFERIGTLDVADSAGELDALRDARDRLREFGARAELVEGEALAEFGVAPDEVAGALYTPDDGYLDPAEIVQYFVEEARSAGAMVETSTEVTDVVTEDGRVAAVETPDGRIAASAVVNAAGPWAPQVNDLVDVSLPLRHNFGPVLVLQQDADVDLPFLEFPDGHYFREEGRQQVFAGTFGATFEDADVVDPTHAHSIDHEFYLDVEERVARLLHGLDDVELVNEWVGLRTITPDGRPFVGETDCDGCYVACGMNGLGVTLAPEIGRLVATAIDDDGRPGRELAEYLSPGRAISQ